MKIDELNLTVRPSNCLKRAGILTVEQLMSMSKEELMAVKGMGLHSVAEVIEAVKKLSMTTGDRVRGMDDEALARFIRNEQCDAVLLQRIESVPAIMARLGRIEEVGNHGKA